MSLGPKSFLKTANTLNITPGSISYAISKNNKVNFKVTKITFNIRPFYQLTLILRFDIRF